ncbi:MULTISPECIES: shikimate kinase AroL [unclassified Gilliamella]|uniref:shikimate kinase AroL n=1 Tax=unclassified Gilliamella TaxID=2685620 RepID=UPI001C69B84E|nr:MULTISPECIES: shikimate kinase AroL [unclassified Gilliamella]MCX8601998.1 shikimate kinase AroL [Gilliamella sp. B3722]MCX8607932.1 shikimate kinase AroL [Gilliamella sp. B3771]MCX8611267.1 shikimate kinase AroL [Gilliamella sp. B3891]MCX8613839.1 shikimate kinase AroL [Gilliamella sp. B3773]MCX8616053.1 shikimate kinase AroL [Gilliamella sp. B3770]
MNNTIFLVGARAAGKTTMGKMLANKLAYSFIDTDCHLLETTQKTVAEIVEKEGWEGFRARESQVLVDTTKPNRVIATGGGMVLADHNRDFMKENGIVIFLSAPAATLAARLMKDPNVAQRPSLTGLSIVDEMEKVLADRLPLYHDAAHHVINVDQDESQILAQILTVLQN